MSVSVGNATFEEEEEEEEEAAEWLLSALSMLTLLLLRLLLLPPPSVLNDIRIECFKAKYSSLPCFTIARWCFTARWLLMCRRRSLQVFKCQVLKKKLIPYV
jgi:hypothetical protein